MEKNFESLNKNTSFTLCPGYFFIKDIDGIYVNCNESMAFLAGLTSPKDITGKTDYDLPWKENADLLRANDKAVMQSRKENALEEVMKSADGKVSSYVVSKKPIYDDQNNVIGISGIAIDMTERKQYEENLFLAKEKAEKETKNTLLNLDQIVASMPGSVFWKNCEGVYLGLNDELARMVGLPKDEILGKTDYQLKWDLKIAEAFVQKDREVILSGKPKLNFEEPPFKLANGKTILQLVNKVPLRNEQDEVVGVVGIGIDITDRKRAEAERDAAYKAQLEANAQFAKVTNQVVHDIRSPLASLLIIIKSCKDLPEMERIALREAARGIGDIANNLLSRYKKDESEISTQEEERKSILLSATILQLLTDKRFQYKNLSIQFEDNFSQKARFAFIQVELSSFKRMISNLINNAVDAFENKAGVVTVKLDASVETVRVIVNDNGKGMPPHVIDKIMQNVAFTEGKSDGHGIGLTQVRDTLQRNEGKLSIQSVVGQGTEFILEFPRISTPNWIAEEISLGENDRVIILDDDSSIHRAWDTRFESILQKKLGITVKHFEICHDALDFIRQFAEDKKQKIFLLTDYELLKQELNGLNVIERAGINRSILVTSHYADPIVLELAVKMGTKILPKQLASEVPIRVIEKGNLI